MTFVGLRIKSKLYISDAQIMAETAPDITNKAL